jgi:cobalt/nickel transport system ATP-binding protein
MLRVSNLSVEYADGTRAIEDLSFSIEAGESVALIGANGAGKTTLLLAIVGVLPPIAGEISLHSSAAGKKEKKNAPAQAARGAVKPELVLTQRTGKDTLRELRARVGVVFQNPDDQLFMPGIYEDVAFGPRSFGIEEAETVQRVDAALSSLGIAHLADRSPLKLSGGEKRLAAIATVLAMKPDLLLFDEPTAYLDPRAKRNLAQIVSGLPQGKLIATHDMAFAAETCSRVLLIREGSVMEDGPRDILFNARKLEAAGL